MLKVTLMIIKRIYYNQCMNHSNINVQSPSRSQSFHLEARSLCSQILVVANSEATPRVPTHRMGSH
jgi:hypothetical protein